MSFGKFNETGNKKDVKEDTEQKKVRNQILETPKEKSKSFDKKLDSVDKKNTENGDKQSEKNVDKNPGKQGLFHKIKGNVVNKIKNRQEKMENRESQDSKKETAEQKENSQHDRRKSFIEKYKVDDSTKKKLDNVVEEYNKKKETGSNTDANGDGPQHGEGGERTRYSDFYR